MLLQKIHEIKTRNGVQNLTEHKFDRENLLVKFFQPKITYTYIY